MINCVFEQHVNTVLCFSLLKMQESKSRGIDEELVLENRIS